MFHYFNCQKERFLFATISRAIVLALSLSLMFAPSAAHAQSVLSLPQPGAMVMTSSLYNPAIITGMTLYPNDPLRFDFLVDIGDDKLQGEDLKKESKRLVNYFMAALTVPEDEMWVNLSPYEKDRIIAQGLGNTEMGRDMLAQDYILKQLTASLMYPENDFGKEFWNRIHAKTQEKFGTTEVPANTFNKIWIVPETATVSIHETSVFVVESHLKVMLEDDYLALEHHDQGLDQNASSDLTEESKQIIREIMVPEIEREVNEGKNFANLRQIYNSMILATWYKKNFSQSLLGQLFANQNKTNGINVEDKEITAKIYEQYVEAFEKGVYNYIREDYDATTQEIIPRKYFSGGADLDLSEVPIHVSDAKRPRRDGEDHANVIINLSLLGGITGSGDDSSSVRWDIENFKKTKSLEIGNNRLQLAASPVKDEYTDERRRTVLKSLGFATIATLITGGNVIGATFFDGGNSDGSAFLRAAFDGDIKKVKELLKRGVDINTKNAKGETGLILAAKNGQLKIVKFLAKKVKSDHERLAIYSAENGDSNNMESLLEEDVNVNIMAYRGGTELMEAVQSRSAETVKDLLDEGADVNAKTRDGWTALILAVQNGDIEIVKILIENGADVKVQRKVDRATVLMLAAQNGYIEIAKILIENGADVNIEVNGVTALKVAAQNGDLDITKVLLKGEAGDPSLGTALRYAVQNGHFDIVKFLVNEGTDIDSKTDDGWSPLLLAVHGMHWKIVKLLVKNGADVDVRETKEGWSASLMAAYVEHIMILEILIDAGADVTVKSYNGQSAIGFAKNARNRRLIKMILDASATKEDAASSPLVVSPNIHIVEGDTDTLWIIASEYGMSDKEIFELNPEKHISDFLKSGDEIKIDPKSLEKQHKAFQTTINESSKPILNFILRIITEQVTPKVSTQDQLALNFFQRSLAYYPVNSGEPALTIEEGYDYGTHDNIPLLKRKLIKVGAEKMIKKRIKEIDGKLSSPISDDAFVGLRQLSFMPENGKVQQIKLHHSQEIFAALLKNNFIDSEGNVTDKFTKETVFTDLRIHPKYNVVNGSGSIEQGILKILLDAKSDNSVGDAVENNEKFSSSVAIPGGIDFNANNLDLSEQGNQMNFNFPAVNLQNIPSEINFNGILPVIINVSPLPNLFPLLGLKSETKEEELSLL